MHTSFLHVVGVHAFVFMALKGCVATDVVEVRLEQNAMLPCPHQYSLGDVTLLQWVKFDEGQNKLLANWIGGESKSLGSPRFSISSNLSLTIRSILSTDGGIYQCRVVTLHTIDSREPTHEVILHIYGTSSEIVKSFVGKSVKFVCPSSGEPRNHTGVTWMKYSHGMSQGLLNLVSNHDITSPRYLRGSDFSLTIENIMPYDQGVYECKQTATGRVAGVLHTVYFRVIAKPARSPLIDGCRNDGVQCEQQIAVGTNAFFTCRMDNIYPVEYPTWDEEKEYREKVTNTDGTFNTSCSVVVSGADIPAERVCTFVMEGFNASSFLILEELQLSDHRANCGERTLILAFAIVFGTFAFVMCLVWCAILCKKLRQSDQYTTVMERVIMEIHAK